MCVSSKGKLEDTNYSGDSNFWNLVRSISFLYFFALYTTSFNRIIFVYFHCSVVDFIFYIAVIGSGLFVQPSSSWNIKTVERAADWTHSFSLVWIFVLFCGPRQKRGIQGICGCLSYLIQFNILGWTHYLTEWLVHIFFCLCLALSEYMVVVCNINCLTFIFGWLERHFYLLLLLSFKRTPCAFRSTAI